MTKYLVIIFTFIFSSSIHLFAQEATGGDEVYEIEIDGKTYRVHAFKTVGSHQFTVNQDLEVDVLVVGGGGGEKTSYNPQAGGGGGAGGLIFISRLIYNNQNISIVVGDGGKKTGARNGQNSSFENLIAYGGGVGGGWDKNGISGGSGGGAGSGGVATTGGSGISNQGNKGGDSNLGIHTSGGGGGAGGAGERGNSSRAGKGGDGKNFSDYFGIRIGDSGWFSGGGGGGQSLHAPSFGLGGLGGGGNGGYSTGIDGLINTGGGGGGGVFYASDGGSGIVIVRYEISAFNLNIDNASTDITPTQSLPNFTLSGTIEYLDDGEATSVEVTATIGGIEKSVDVTVSEDMSWQLSWSYNDLSEGEYTDLEFTATSNSSETEETTSTYTGKIIIDKTAPTCGSWSPSESPWKVSGGGHFTLTSSSDAGGSGLATASASVSCSTGPIHGDTCPVTIFDNAGNDKICTSPINRVDIFAPNLIVTPAITGWQGDKQDIIILSNDEQTSLARIAYAWDLNTLGSDCSGGTTINSGDNLRLTISGGANPLYVCSVKSPI